MLVALGSASFCVIVVELMQSFDGPPYASPIDAGRIIEGIIGGIGFLGAGAIIQERDRIVGATTGAGIPGGRRHRRGLRLRPLPARRRGHRPGRCSC